MSLNTPQLGAQASPKTPHRFCDIQTSGTFAASKLTSSAAFVINAVDQRAATRVQALEKESRTPHLPRRPAFAVCGFPSCSNVGFFNEVFAHFFGDAGCYALQSLWPRANRSVRRRYPINSHSNASSTFVNTRRSTHRFCATVSRKQCESRCPGLQTATTLHLYCSKTRVLFPNSYLSTREISAGTSVKSRRSLFLFVH